MLNIPLVFFLSTKDVLFKMCVRAIFNIALADAKLRTES
jgi:hypothetical protein